MKWIVIAQLVLELLKRMKEKEKGEGLSEDDILGIAGTAYNNDLINSNMLGYIKKSAPDIKSMLEDIVGLLK